MSQGQRFLAFAAATVALLLILGVVGPRLLGLAAGPEVEVLTALKLAERRAADVSLGWGTLHPTSMQYQRMGVTVDADGRRAVVVATLDLVGNIERPGVPWRTRVSSLGLERVEYRLVGTDWVVTGSTLERLRAVLGGLERRRVAVEAEAPTTAHRVFRAEAWFIRSERDEVLVTEDSRLQEDLPERPVDELKTTRLTLGELDGGFVVQAL